MNGFMEDDNFKRQVVSSLKTISKLLEFILLAIILFIINYYFKH